MGWSEAVLAVCQAKRHPTDGVATTAKAPDEQKSVPTQSVALTQEQSSHAGIC